MTTFMICLDLFINKSLEFSFESLFAKPERAAPNCARIPGYFLKTIQGMHHTRYGLFVKENPRLIIDNRLQGAPFAKCNHWRTRCLRFDGHDAKVLFRSKYKALSLLQHFTNCF